MGMPQDVAHPSQKEVNTIIDMRQHLVKSIRKQIGGANPTPDHQIVRMGGIGLSQMH